MTTSYTTDALTIPKIQSMADALTVPDGGFTVDVVTGESPTFGYSVSVHPDAERVLALPVTAQDLIEFAADRADYLAESGAHFGGWHDPWTSKIHLDVAVRVLTARTAGRLAAEHGQLAYFDLEAGESVSVLGDTVWS